MSPQTRSEFKRKRASDSEEEVKPPRKRLKRIVDLKDDEGWIQKSKKRVLSEDDLTLSISSASDSNYYNSEPEDIALKKLKKLISTDSKSSDEDHEEELGSSDTSSEETSDEEELDSSSDEEISDKEEVDTPSLGNESEREDPDWKEDLNYFDLDKTKFAKILTQQISKHLDQVDYQDLSTAVTKTVDTIDKATFSEYVSVEPKDSHWKMGMDEETIEKVSPLLREIRQKIRESAISIPKIVCAEISMIQKQKALRLYDALQNEEPYTANYLCIEQQIKDILERKDDTQQFRDQISNLNTNEEIKHKLNLLVDEIQNNDSEKDTHYNYLMDKLKWYLRLPYDTQATPIIRQFQEDVSMELVVPVLGSEMEIDEDLVQIGDLSLNKINQVSEIEKFLLSAKEHFDRELFGMQHVKERLLSILCMRLTSKNKYSILGLSGPPGVGKTSICKVLSTATKLPYFKVALGGMSDSGIFTGTNARWLGSSPGVICQGLAEMKCNDGIFFFDEVDKLSGTSHSEQVQFSLLHITDYTQNDSYSDAYLKDVNFDLSNLWFMFSMNNPKFVDPTLLDRMEIIEIKEYKPEEKIQIIKKYTLPKILAKYELENQISISESACRILSKEGLRDIEKQLQDIVARINVVSKIPTFSIRSQILTQGDIKDFYGFPYQIGENLLPQKPRTQPLSYYM